MVRWWLVLAVVGGLAGTAFAKREPACVCRTAVTLPRQGATDVPTNARFWTIPANGTTPAPDQRIQSYELTPHTAYELNAQQLSFTTGAGRDDTPPMEPGIGWVSISLVRPRGDVASVAISGTFDQDTAVVRVRFVTAAGRVTYYTTPDALHVCDAGITLEGGPVHVEVVAIDLAGNESTPATFDTTATFEVDHVPYCTDDHQRWRGRGEAMGMLFAFLGPFIGIAAFIALLLFIAWRSGRPRPHSEPEPLALASTLHLARAIRLRARLALATAVAAAVSASAGELIQAIVFLASPVLLSFAIWGLVRWIQATRVLRLLGYDGAAAELNGNRLTVVVGGKVALLTAPTRLIEDAKRNALPQARRN